VNLASVPLQVGLVGVESPPVIPRASIFGSRDQNPETIPICPEAILEMEAFMTSFTPDTVDYSASFERAFSLFSDGNTTGEEEIKYVCTLIFIFDALSLSLSP
jgi:hypothetical protein